MTRDVELQRPSEKTPTQNSDKRELKLIQNEPENSRCSFDEQIQQQKDAVGSLSYRLLFELQENVSA